MPCRRAPLELTADIRATLETISRSRSAVRDASDHALATRRRSRARASAPEGRALRRQGELGALAALLAEVGAASRFLARLGCSAGLSPKDLGYAEELWTMAVAARSIAKSICRSWLRGRCGKFFLNRRSALTKYHTNDGIRNSTEKWLKFCCFTSELLHERKISRTRHWSPTFPMMRNQAFRRPARLRPTFRPGHYPRSGRIQTPRNGMAGMDLVTGHIHCSRSRGRTAPIIANPVFAEVVPRELNPEGAKGGAQACGLVSSQITGQVDLQDGRPEI